MQFEPNMDDNNHSRAVFVRKFEASDDPAVQRIYRQGLMELIPDFAFRALTHHPECFLLYAAMTVVCFMLTMCWCVIGLVPAVVLCLHYFYSRRVVHGYLRYAMKDMRDIENFYIKTPGSCLWVAVLEGKVVGLVAGLGLREGSDSGGALELLRMSVDPRYRKRGVGFALGQKLLEFAVTERYSSVVLETASYTAAAHQLYLRLGFRHAGVTDGYALPGSTGSLVERTFHRVRVHRYVKDLQKNYMNDFSNNRHN